MVCLTEIGVKKKLIYKTTNKQTNNTISQIILVYLELSN